LWIIEGDDIILMISPRQQDFDRLGCGDLTAPSLRLVSEMADYPRKEDVGDQASAYSYAWYFVVWLMCITASALIVYLFKI
jgi:hypothetical protein